MTGQDTWPQVEVTSVEELRAWLAEHHDTLERAWLITWKKADRDRHVSYEELVRQLLCFGWIDSTARSVDDERIRIVDRPPPAEEWLVTTQQGSGGRADRSRVDAAGRPGRHRPGQGVRGVDGTGRHRESRRAGRPAHRAGREPRGATVIGTRFRARPSAASWSGSAMPSGSRPGPNGSSRPSNWPPTTSAPTSRDSSRGPAIAHDRARHPTVVQRSALPRDRALDPIVPTRRSPSVERGRDTSARVPPITEPLLG